MHTQGGRWPKEWIEALAKAGKAGNEQAIEQMKVLLYDSFPCHLVYPYAVTIDFERERFPYPKVYELLQRFVDSVEKDGPVMRKWSR